MIFSKDIFMSSHPVQDKMNEWYNFINVTMLQVIPRLLEIIDKQHSILKAYDKSVDKAKQIVQKKGNSPIELHLMGINFSGHTDKLNNYYNFIK